MPCGRPLLVDGAPRVARAISRDDWTANLASAHCECPEAARAWRDDALQEHASIASFARLALELLALGAPPELVAAANTAALDEIEHARTCFAIAARFGHERVGPAPVSFDGVTISGDLATVALEAARESCIGETVAALVLARAAELCAPELAPVLEKMADDELTHATLGWKIVGWACARDASLRERVKRDLVVGAYGAPSPVDIESWHRAGRLTSADMLAITATARALIADVAALI